MYECFSEVQLSVVVLAHTEFIGLTVVKDQRLERSTEPSIWTNKFIVSIDQFFLILSESKLRISYNYCFHGFIKRFPSKKNYQHFGIVVFMCVTIWNRSAIKLFGNKEKKRKKRLSNLGKVSTSKVYESFELQKMVTV